MATNIVAPMAREDLFALYLSGPGDHEPMYLPVVGVDDSNRALVMTDAGKVVVATRARPRSDGVLHSFDGVRALQARDRP